MFSAAWLLLLVRIILSIPIKRRDETAPTNPFPELFSKGGSEAIASALDQFRAPFFPEGTDYDALPTDVLQEHRHLFASRPEVFSKCFLVHTYAKPYRVGSSMREEHIYQHKLERDIRHQSEPPEDEQKRVAPDLLLEGGVYQKDNRDIEFEADAFAFLESLSGEVQVVANGAIRKWTSKARVPIAGYLCPSTSGESAWLYTLETPCVPKTLNDDGQPLQPTDGAYVVSVGDTELHFSSKSTGDQFCEDLTKEIADDLAGDAEYDAARFTPKVVNPEAPAFLQSVRVGKAKGSWTKGTKSVVVAIMDWKYGDNSVAPLSRQKLTPSYVKEHILPRVTQAFKEMSYDKFKVDITVIPEVVRYTQARSRYKAAGYPFPGLYDGARASVAGHRTYGTTYNFDKFDLAYVIAPRQEPKGTKGVAWVGAKGAMCNGCEEISENFQVMVAVHELGHNLGLSHASSADLAYGNPFDWMGNYPDVQGLSFGLGYKRKLGWADADDVPLVDDSEASDINDLFYLKPFDSTDSAEGLKGIQIRLSKNPYDVYISYRGSINDNSDGVFILYQDKDSANSKLMDAGCHTPSQQDAALQPDWVYIEPSQQLAIKTVNVTKNLASVHIFALSSTAEVASLRARPTFTDGAWKCPRTCTDADLLVADYGSCTSLESQGYCTGTMTLSGKKHAIGETICPRACGNCASTLSGESVRDGGCKDSDVTISGMTCATTARRGYCAAKTNSGVVGFDLCPKSCDLCPPKPDTSVQADGARDDPTPARTHGKDGSLRPSIPQAPQKNNSTSKNTGGDAAEKEQCEDDADWTDADGDGCMVYSTFIAEKKITQDGACNWGDGSASVYCKKTCNKCAAPSDDGSKAADATSKPVSCGDKKCVSHWMEKYGLCFECENWTSYCDKSWFAGDCRRTCKKCTAADGDGGDVTYDYSTSTTTTTATTTTATTTTATTTTTTTTPTLNQPCVESECVDEWVKQHGKCYRCENYPDHCKEEYFVRSCPITCKRCSPEVPAACGDDLETYTCERYSSMGWCEFPSVSNRCKGTCGKCPPKEAPSLAGNVSQQLDQGKSRSSAPSLTRDFTLFYVILLLAAL